jgi:hypothetical protein
VNQHVTAATSVALAGASWLTLANQYATLAASTVAIVAGVFSIVLAVRKLRGK